MIMSRPGMLSFSSSPITLFWQLIVHGMECEEALRVGGGVEHF
jgi:hypothetical protein